MSRTPQYRFITIDSPEFHEARKLRYSVLYEPLGIAESSVDWGDDATSAHCVAFVGGAMVGYGRLVRDGSFAQVRHLAVLPGYRMRGVGGGLLDQLLELARDLGVRSVFLNARFTAWRLYADRGFESMGPVIHTESSHLPHQRMELDLCPAPRAVLTAPRVSHAARRPRVAV
jgi:GNAT superfamily N-acetyltransferase